MKKKIIGFVFLIIIIVSIFSLIFLKKNEKVKNLHSLNATIIKSNNNKITVQDKKNIIYTFKSNDDNDISVGDEVVIRYSGVLNKIKNVQTISLVDYEVIETSKNEDGIPSGWLDDGVFSDYYTLAYNKLKTLSLDEKIGQLFLVRYFEDKAITDLKKNKFSGFVLYERDFIGKTESEVKKMIKNLQNNSTIPLLIAVDEEGGNVVRVSSNENLVDSRFKSPGELYSLGGFSKIREDTIEKSKILNNLGINLNLAPVVDVSTNSSDYIYDRTLQQNTELTSKYAKTVISASKGYGVSYTLKHFPGYGNNTDTHTGTSIDSRTYDSIITNDLPPFESGIDEGAEAVLVSHNIVTSIDPDNPASLSVNVHNLLRNNLDFTGVVITDDLSMGALSSVSNAVVKAILAGNDLIITTDYERDISSIKSAIESGRISENLIDKLAFRVLAWKYYKGLMFEMQK